MHLKKTNSGYIAYCDDTLNNIEKTWFDVAYWQQQSAVTGSSRGRYITWFVATHDTEWVLRHYYRGGMIGNLCKDSYLYTGIKSTRAIAELNLLEVLFNEGFPVPKPIAAHIEKQGMRYRADIIIERIHGAKDLVALLTTTEMTSKQWQSLGACIARFHHRGVFHADLNAKNILISEEGFYLIDFDRGQIRSPSSKWQQANLERLLRSFNKEKRKQAKLAFTQENWKMLLQGYTA